MCIVDAGNFASSSTGHHGIIVTSLRAANFDSTFRRTEKRKDFDGKTVSKLGKRSSSLSNALYHGNAGP
jgi:hypothetical protein